MGALWHVHCYSHIRQLGGPSSMAFHSTSEDSQASVEEILGELAERYTWYQGKYLDGGEAVADCML